MSPLAPPPPASRDTASPSGAELLALEPLGGEADAFRSLHNLDSGVGALFGGQAVAQALAAAARTVEGAWPAHSLTGHYLRGGDPAQPVDYRVERTRDGRRYASRRVLARQGGRAIVDMLCAFHNPEEGPEHRFGDAAPPAPPEALQNLKDFLNANAETVGGWMPSVYRGGWPIELKIPDPMRTFKARAERPERTYWFRLARPAGTDEAGAHQQLLAFLSDFWFAGTAATVHTSPAEASLFGVVTLNHSLWFHAPARADDWLLYQTDSPWAGQGRGLVRGTIYDREGRHVATAVQEISMRRLPQGRP